MWTFHTKGRVLLDRLVFADDSTSEVCSSVRSVSKPLHPRPYFDFPGPGTAVLLHQMQVARCDGVGIEGHVGTIGGVGAAARTDPTVDDHMGDMNALRAEFAGHALGKAAQR